MRVAVSGSWRHTPPKLLADPHREGSAMLARGDELITGGALGVDYEITQMYLAEAEAGIATLRVILPTTLEIYAAHYRARADEGVITARQAEALITQLERVRELRSLYCGGWERVDKHSYYARNSEVVRDAQKLLAFQVGGSAGTGDTVEKARAAGMEVVVYEYE